MKLNATELKAACKSRKSSLLLLSDRFPMNYVKHQKIGAMNVFEKYDVGDEVPEVSLNVVENVNTTSSAVLSD